ncbi:MAG TPA: redoxin domain-containing protein [Gemmatimonadaceae bacterium]
MEAYRDQYATLFNNGRDVVVLGISVDPDTTLINWFRDIETPIMVMSDADASVSRTYQAYNETSKTDARHLYVVDGAGRITYKATPFRVMAQDAFTELDAEVDKLAPPKPPDSD